jgi:hypothetical protein
VEVRLGLEVSAGWANPSSRDLWVATLCCFLLAAGNRNRNRRARAHLSGTGSTWEAASNVYGSTLLLVSKSSDGWEPCPACCAAVRASAAKIPNAASSVCSPPPTRGVRRIMELTGRPTAGEVQP